MKIQEYIITIAFFSVIILMVVGFAGIFIALFIGNQNFDLATDNAKEALSKNHLIVKGEINSPTVIEITRDYDYFSSAIENQTKIYEVSSYFVAVFNGTYGLEYRPEYYSPKWGFWG